jgi:broad specificity phosphatase PhoE
MNEVLRRASSVGVALAVFCAAASQVVAQEPTSATTTVILVRHAEKASAPAADPPLTSAGEARAKALLEAVRGAGVTAIITTPYERTRATAAPSASALGITPEVVTATGRTHAKDVAAAIRKHAGQTILVVGHSNTIPEIIGELGASVPPLCDAEYDNLYVVLLPPSGSTKLIRSKFGRRSVAGAACASMK